MYPSLRVAWLIMARIRLCCKVPLSDKELYVLRWGAPSIGRFTIFEQRFRGQFESIGGAPQRSTYHSLSGEGTLVFPETDFGILA